MIKFITATPIAKILNFIFGMSRKNYISQFFLLLALCFPAALKAERLPLKLYTSADGLASGAIFRIERDSRGFLWFATRDGLSRFDGREFVTYRLEGSENAPIFNTTLETRDGSFWISASGGVYRVKPDKEGEIPAEVSPGETNFYKIIRAERVAENAPAVMFEDSRGRVWGGSTELTLFSENGEIKPQPYDLGAIARDKRGASVSSIIEGRDGSLWVGCDTGAMRILPDNRRILYPIKRLSNYDETRSLIEDREGRIWVGHSTGVFVFQPETLEELSGAVDSSVRAIQTEEKPISSGSETVALPNAADKMLRLMFAEQMNEGVQTARQTANIRRIFKSADGKIWIPAGGSLFVFDGGTYRRLTHTNGISDVVTSINEDAAGNVWFATEGGALKFERHGLTTYAVAEGLRDPRVHSIYESADGSLIVVHGDWRVSRVREDGIESSRLNLPDSHRFLWTSPAVLPDRHQNWWALSANGLYRFDAKNDPALTGSQKPERIAGQISGLASESLYAAFEDSRGDLWFSTRDTSSAGQSGLARLESETGKWRVFTAADGFPAGASARSFAEDASGNVWCGFYGGGLARFDGERFNDYSKQENFPKGAILGLYFDRKKRLWIGSTADGLNLVEDPNATRLAFKRYSVEQGLASNNVRAVTGDLQGNIYAGTIRGVDRINPDTGSVRHYSTADGLASDSITAAFTDRRGRVWFGAPNGLSKLESENAAAVENTAPQILINNLQIAGVNRQISIFGQREVSEINLSSAENNLNIGFLSVGDGLRYQYKLDGDGNTDWSRPTAERNVNFAGLAPGNYRFLVRAVDSNNQASENPAKISFSIAPPFWRTWEFIGSIIFVAGCGVILLDRYRVMKTREVESALVKSQAAEKATKESETRFRTLAETASDAIITIDEQSRVVFVNPAVEKIFGYRAEELVGENLTMLMPEKMRPSHDDGFGRYLTTSRKRIAWNGIELPGRHKSGAELPIEVSFGEFERDGKRFFTGIIRDISERRKAEEALRQAREERVEELQRVRTRIATDLHDDIGSSLTQISVLTEVARSQAILDTVKTPLERISDVSNELVDAIADIVWAINPKKDSLRELVLRMRRFASDVFSARDIEFELDAPEDLNGIRLGANIRREVFAIFKECVNNIVRHAAANEAAIRFEIIENHLRLEIKDDGRGFDAERILSDDFTPEKGGNGLINMRRRAAELGGNCRIASSADGTTTILDIPLTAFEAAAIHTDSDAERGNGLH